MDGAKAEELPTRDALMGDAKKMLDTVVALRNAPIVEEEYRGPVLFAPDAADDVVASLIGQNVVGRKPQLGKPNRTTGSFAASYKTRVLPTFLSGVGRSGDEGISRAKAPWAATMWTAKV